MYVTSDGALKIENPKVENSGHYVCTAVNSVGAVLARSHLVVFDPEDFATENHLKTNFDEAKKDLFGESAVNQIEFEEARLALLEKTIGSFQADPLSPTSIKVSWSPVESGPASRYVEGFRVHFRRRRTDRYENFDAVTIPHPTTDSFTIHR